MHGDCRSSKRGERETATGVGLQCKKCSPWCTLTLGHVRGAALMAQVIFNYVCTERSKSGELKSARATLGRKVRMYKNFASNVNSWGKVGVSGGNGGRAGHCHSPPCWPQRPSPGSAQGLRVGYCISFSNLEICYKCISDKN